VESEGVYRDYEPPWDGGIYDVRDEPPAPMTIRIGEMYSVGVSLKCDYGDWDGRHQVLFQWLPDGDVIDSTWLETRPDAFDRNEILGATAPASRRAAVAIVREIMATP